MMTEQKSNRLSQNRVKELLSYDPKTGIFIWLITNSNRAPAGTIAGRKRGRDIKISIDGTEYFAHRVAWLWMTGQWPDRDIDHKDLNPRNNQWSNLRLATESQNGHNTEIPKNNTSGFKGVHWAKDRERWIAKITVNGMTHYLGDFDVIDDAAEAYCQASQKYIGEFSRT